MVYKPRAETAHLLNVAKGHIASVPYKVSLRWTFYRLLQDGIFNSKEDYKARFINKTSVARKRWYNGWTPDIVQDDTRGMIWKGIGAWSEKDWISELDCKLDKIGTQDYFVMICFEARAMYDQFSYYTKNIPLVPFGGDPSIPYKWEIAKAIERAAKIYNKPIKVLYFGDCDKKGSQIGPSAFKDIRAWCSAEFDLIYCGLTQQQAQDMNLMENPDKPGEYQWEALTDAQAMKIITENVAPLQDIDRYEPVEELENDILSRAKDKLGVGVKE